MTKKKSPSLEEFVQDLDIGSQYDEYDPDAPAAEAQAVAEAVVDAGAMMPPDDLFLARDALQNQIGALVTAHRAAIASSAAAVAMTADDHPGTRPDNIVGFGVGLNKTAGTYTGDLVAKVYVREKVPESKLPSALAVPSNIDGIDTDVEEIGELSSFSYRGRYARPAPCGVSCGHVKITAGTIGALVALKNNRLCILSNNHVLANENDASPGDQIIQPGRVDGGAAPADVIGALERFVPLIYGGGINRVDAAVAWTNRKLVRGSHVTYKLNPTPLQPTINLAVIKNGRTTQATQGMITDIGVNQVAVTYQRGTAYFNNQIFIRGIGASPFSQGGDSGSLIVSANSKQPVALLFAGSSSHTIATPIAAVMAELGIAAFLNA